MGNPDDGPLQSAVDDLFQRHGAAAILKALHRRLRAEVATHKKLDGTEPWKWLVSRLFWLANDALVYQRDQEKFDRERRKRLGGE